MMAKIVFVVILATLSVSLAKDDGFDDKIISSETNSTNRIAKMSSVDLDLIVLFNKYKASDKKNQARIYFQNQLKRAVALTNVYIKRGFNESEEVLQTIIEKIEHEDAVLGKKLYDFYDKARELSEISEDINKYVTYVDHDDKAKISFRPLLEQKVVDLIKNFESKVFAAVIKKSKGKF